MSNKTMGAVAKGMLIGAVAGGSIAYISGMDIMCKCRCVRKKFCVICKNMRKIMSR